MKKPALATLGVVGACAACCTIPLAIPLLSGLSVAGLVSIDWDGLNLGSEVATAAMGLVAAVLVGGGIWWQRKRKATTACAAPSGTAAASPAPAGSGCGCSSSPKSKENS
ncbi:MAG: hypothetical protein Q8O29_05285 [Polaromonas sp.]|uniref:hypothetical protein n=1 Tax=Polaromonas sp. TaxID=1869339 RepID=UPI0027344BF0|nr:hypothetical protein [Polaromonas sp.]MDP2817683.1 hypothetical protein [Polaromonas sp.]